MKKHHTTQGEIINKIPKGLTEQDLDFLNLASQYMVSTEELEDIIKREAKTREAVNKYYEDNFKNEDWLVPNTNKLIAKLSSIYANPFQALKKEEFEKIIPLIEDPVFKGLDIFKDKYCLKGGGIENFTPRGVILTP